MEFLEHKGRLLSLLRQANASKLDWYPDSYLLGSEDDVKQFAAVVRHTRQEKLFCLKPQMGTEGKGIEIVSSTQLQRYAAQFFTADQMAVHPAYREYLAQSYIQHPLLLGHNSRFPDRKFDFRIHAFAAMRIAPDLESAGSLTPQFWSFFYPAPLVKVAVAKYKSDQATEGEHKQAHILNAHPDTTWLSTAELWEELPKGGIVPSSSAALEKILIEQVATPSCCTCERRTVQVEGALTACFHATQNQLLQDAISKAIFGKATTYSFGQQELAIAREKLPGLKWEL